MAYTGTNPEKRTRYGNTVFEARVRHVSDGKVDDQLVTITGREAGIVKVATDGVVKTFEERAATFDLNPKQVIARMILRDIDAGAGEDFHTLNYGQVSRLVKYASAVHYRRPRNANGSTARYFYQFLQRMIVRVTK